MFNILSFFKKKNPEAAQVNNDGSNASFTKASESSSDTTSSMAKHWFGERHETAVTQRNFMLAVAVISLVGVAVAVLAVTQISLSKEFDPFVIQIEKNTGVAKVVKPLDPAALKSVDALGRYFVKKYVVARETYNPVDFETSARRLVRLFSSPQIYSFYRGYIRNKDNDPIIKYGQKNSTFLTVKSWSKLAPERYVLRFAISETSGPKRVYHKIAIIDYHYTPMELNPGEEDVNPVGFQITGYRVDDDQS